ncbi:MAG TPA: hypothetical protein VHZ03_14005 [Trebonia sp.]|jgi:hypothetical protein|nr:hypothetical protein [Trebonia sp.]
MKLRAGQTLASTVDTTAVIVVRACAQEVAITCGGAAMVDSKAAVGAPEGVPDPGQMDGTLIGKRYADDDLGLELLVTKPGKGTLAVDGRPLPVKGARPLPASD